MRKLGKWNVNERQPGSDDLSIGGLVYMKHGQKRFSIEAIGVVREIEQGEQTEYTVEITALVSRGTWSVAKIGDHVATTIKCLRVATVRTHTGIENEQQVAAAVPL